MPDEIQTDAPVVVNQTNVDAASLIPAVTTIVTEAKAGYKTTEFWVAIVVSLLTLLNGIPLPEKFEGVVVALTGVAYVLSRGLAKSGVPNEVVAVPTDESLAA